jgi:diguanylate cyclase (GGDEF)-like protein/PAS domain S-box-containing protein
MLQARGFIAISKGMGSHLRTILKLFASFYCPFALLLTLLFYGILKTNAEIQLSTLQAREMAQAAIAAHLLAYDFQLAVSDLLVLSKAPAFMHYLAAQKDSEKKRMLEEYMSTVREKQIYQQIGYINERGKALAHVTVWQGVPTVSSEDKLASIEDRVFFQNTSQLLHGEVFISPTDLNIEQKKTAAIENLKMHFGTPVFDYAGKRRGIIFINLFGEKLLLDFRDAMQGAHLSMLVNDDGYRLSNLTSGDKSPVIIGDRFDFAQHYPHEWEIILKNAQGSILTKHGLFSYATVYPLLIFKQHVLIASPLSASKITEALRGKTYFWKLISYVPTVDLPYPTFTRHPLVLAIYGTSLTLLALLVAYLVIMLVSRRQVMQALHRSSEEIEGLYNNAPCGYHSLDTNGFFIRINATELQWLGYEYAEVIGKKKFSDFLTQQSFDLFQQAFPKFKEQGFVKDLEYELIRKNGSIFNILLNAVAVYDAGGHYLMSRSTMFDMTQRMRYEAMIHELAYHDGLTHLPNRQLLLDRINQGLVKAERSELLLAVMFLDLDKFKYINDRLGHDIGDELLKTVAVRLSASVRESDTVARSGGDEFVIFLHEINHVHDAELVAKKILAGLNRPVQAKIHELAISASIGIAIYPFDGTTVFDLMKKADMAMYIAKESGRNQYHFYSSFL